MPLYRVRVRPLSPWRTPWQADTLGGMLCWAGVRTEGDAWLRDEILGPASDGSPPFVLSDAFPEGLLPVPAALRLHAWPAAKRKTVKRARWLTIESFRRFRDGEKLTPEDLLTEDPVETTEHVHNSIDRATGTTGGTGRLFVQEESFLSGSSAAPVAEQLLTVYARITAGFEQRFVRLFEELARCGFGADASTGRGSFELVPGLEPVHDLDETREGVDGSIVLSSFQPGPLDPAFGAWETFTKYGKLGPDFGLDNVFKRPLLLLRPGACLVGRPDAAVVGRAVPMEELLAPEVVSTLAERRAGVMHLAYGLAVPARLGSGEWLAAGWATASTERPVAEPR